jgi:dienelactone hydrolase
MIRRPFARFPPKHVLAICSLVIATVALPGCGLELPEVKPVEYERFDLSQIPATDLPPRPSGAQITDYAVEYVTDLGIPDGQPGHDSEVRVVLPRHMPTGRVPALVVNGAGAYLFSGMVLSDEDIEPMLPYVEQGFAIVAYETDGCQPSFERDPTSADIAQMTRRYVASKAGLINAKRALSYALDRFPEIDGNQLYAIGHSSGGKQALLLSTHDERIRGCVAFAPACQMDFGSKMTVARIGGPDGDRLAREVERSMPIAHAKDTDVPMLLVYSANDRVTRPTEVLTYAKAVGKGVIAVPVKCGGHGAVPDAGFKLAVAWLRTQHKKSVDDTNATQLVSQTVENPVDPSPSEPVAPIEQEAPSEQETPGEQETPIEQEAPSVQSEASGERPQPILQLPVQTRSTRSPTLNPAGVQHNPYITD